MKVAANEDTYLIKLTEAEAFELSEFIGRSGRSIREDGRPALEVRISNEMYELGLHKRYYDKWTREYDL